MESLPRVEGRYWIDYRKVLKTKQFEHIIKVQHGGKVENIGYYVHMYLMIDIVIMMNEKFKVELIDVFVTQNILQSRDDGGEQFKLLNISIDTLANRTPELKPKR